MNYTAQKALLKRIGVSEEVFIQKVQKFAPKRFDDLIKRF